MVDIPQFFRFILKRGKQELVLTIPGDVVRLLP